MRYSVMSRPHTYDSLIANTKNVNGCWEWTRGKSVDGYGRVLYYGKNITTHRLVWLLKYGVHPGPMHVLHSCDNPPCINPDHLKLGTHSENMEDMTRRGHRVHLPGDKNPAARLSASEVELIKDLLEQGMRGTNIAKLFNVHKTTISHIKVGRNWSSV